MNQAPGGWGPQGQGPWSGQQPSGGMPADPPPRRDRTRLLLIVAACVVGALSVAAIVLGGVSEKRGKRETAVRNCESALTRFGLPHEGVAPAEVDKGIADCSTAGMTDAGAALVNVKKQLDHGQDAAECKRLVAKFESVAKNEAVMGMDEGVADAKEGVRVCELAGMTSEAAEMRDIQENVDQQRAKAPPVDPASCAKGNVIVDPRTGKRLDCTGGPEKATALDPTSCAKGRRLIDPNTGKSVECTGAAAGAATGTTAGGDDDDIRAVCKSVKAAWDRSDGIDPIIECSGQGPNHQDVEVVVTSAGWEFLGDHGKRRAFAKSLVDAYRPHWKTFHGWSGAEPAGKQVHIVKMKGLDLEVAALTSAGGLYVE